MIKTHTVATLAPHLQGRWLTQTPGEPSAITGISIDSRTLKPGDLFVAIKGPRFDGHDYLKAAQQAGAAVAVISTAVSDNTDVTLPCIQVQDTFQALGQLGALNRQAFSGPLLAVTGSCGKTAVKAMLAAILAQQAQVLATQGNLNNGFGVPLTLSRLTTEHEYAVLELGTSGPGEIDYIARLAKPHVAVLTNAAEAHITGLGSVAGVAHEKGYLLDALCPASDHGGIAVLNQDDPFFPEWRERALSAPDRRVLTFSCHDSTADCFATAVTTTAQGMAFTLHLQGEHCPVTLACWGQHQVHNACAAAAAARAVGRPLAVIAAGLATVRPGPGRGARHRISRTIASGEQRQATLIDETYNANPKAALAAIDQLTCCASDTVMVLGDMLELGDIAADCHQAVGRYAQQQGIDYFASIGPQAQLASQAFGAQGQHFASKMALVAWLATMISNSSAAGLAIVVKGSNSMAMSDVISALVAGNT